MNKIARIGSVILLAVGLGLLVYYTIGLSSSYDKFFALQNPSYFRYQNLTYFFWAVAAATAAAVLSGFFAFLKSLDTPDKAIINPVALDKQGIDAAVGGSTLDVEETQRVMIDGEETEVLRDDQ